MSDCTTRSDTLLWLGLACLPDQTLETLHSWLAGSLKLLDMKLCTNSEWVDVYRYNASHVNPGGPL